MQGVVLVFVKLNFVGILTTLRFEGNTYIIIIIIIIIAIIINIRIIRIIIIIILCTHYSWISIQAAKTIVIHKGRLVDNCP